MIRTPAYTHLQDPQVETELLVTQDAMNV